jgi:hypothetical protein
MGGGGDTEETAAEAIPPPPPPPPPATPPPAAADPAVPITSTIAPQATATNPRRRRQANMRRNATNKPTKHESALGLAVKKEVTDSKNKYLLIRISHTPILVFIMYFIINSLYKLLRHYLFIYLFITSKCN